MVARAQTAKQQQQQKMQTHTTGLHDRFEHTLPSHFFQLPGWGKLWGRTECLELSFYFISQ